MGSKKCTRCGEIYPFSEFYKDRLGRMARCKQCTCELTVAWRKRNAKKKRDSDREYQLQTKYGISTKEYEEMVRKQGGVCEICARPETYRDRSGNPGILNVDHCHSTGKVRALLCRRCNMAIGQFTDDPFVLASALRYLERHK